MKYAKLSDNHEILEVGQGDVVPDGFIQLSDDDYQTLMSNISQRWELDETGLHVIQPSLDVRRAAAWERIKAYRDHIKLGGVLVHVDENPYWFHSDTDSTVLYLGLKDLARDLGLTATAPDVLTIQGQPVLWKTMDGSFVPMSAELIFAVVGAIRDFGSLVFQTAETHHELMLESADPDTYDFTSGWPEIYQPS